MRWSSVLRVGAAIVGVAGGVVGVATGNVALAGAGIGLAAWAVPWLRELQLDDALEKARPHLEKLPPEVKSAPEVSRLRRLSKPPPMKGNEP